MQFGVVSGLGLFPMTFDWAQIAYIGSPLLTPWWAAANVVGGLVLVMWIIAPIMCMSMQRDVLSSNEGQIIATRCSQHTYPSSHLSFSITPASLTMSAKSSHPTSSSIKSHTTHTPESTSQSPTSSPMPSSLPRCLLL